MRGTKMKKFTLKILTALVVLLCSASAFAFAAKATKAAVTTTVTEINQHGNTYLTIRPSLFSAKGFSISDIVTVTINGKKWDMPICKNYSDVDTGAMLLRLTDDSVCLAINMGDFAKETGATVDMEVAITMKQQYGYLTQFHQRLLKSTDVRSDYASDEVFANFREITAGKIAPGKLYRSSSLIEPTARSPYALKLAQNMGIKTIVDIANSQENALKMAANNDFFKALDASGNVYYCEMAISYTDEAFTSKLKEALIFMTEHEGPYLIQGKDGQNRVGIVCAIIEALNGATLKEINDDYMQSYVNYYGIKSDSTQYTEILKTITALFETLNNGAKVTDKNVQKVVEKYLLQTVGLTQVQVDALKVALQ